MLNRTATILLFAAILNACAPGPAGTGGPSVAGSVSTCLADNHVWTNEGDSEPLHWGHFPLTVEIDQSTMTGNQMASAMAAMDTWSDLAGTQLFDYKKVDSIEHSNADVIVTNAELGGTFAGLTSNSVRPGTSVIAYSTVQLDNNWPQNFWYPVSIHEFGHVLDLAHDPDDDGSIMYPYTNPEWNWWHIRQDDVNFVRWEATAAQ